MATIKKLIAKNITFIKYIMVAAFSFILDITLFTVFKILLNEKIASAILVATIMARVISSFVNYLLNRNAVFQNNSGKADSKTLVKYYILVIIQTLISGFAVEALASHFDADMMILFLPIATVIKMPVEMILFVVNYFAQKLFVFKGSDSKLNIKDYIKINDTIVYLALAFITTITLIFKVNSGSKFTASFYQGDNNNFFISVIVFICTYKYYKYYLYKYKSNVLFRLLAVLFSLFMILGYSYAAVGNASLVFGNLAYFGYSCVKLVGYYFLFIVAINIAYDFMCNGKIKEIKIKNKFIDAFNKHPVLVSAIVILICYMPYIISYYPAIMGYDPANQIKEVMGMHTRYMDSVILLDPNMTITNFNPVLHTLLLGGCFKLGHVMGSDNLGLFMYTIIQVALVIATLSYSISYMKKEGVNNTFLFIILAIYALVPMYPFYAIGTNKDMIFCCFILLYCIKVYDLIHHEQTLKKYIEVFLVIIMVVLTRNNGIYTFILSFPFLLIWLKGKRKAILTILIATLLFYVGYNKVLLPTLKISNTSVREILSIPFQQTARYAKEYPEDFTDEDKETIDKILNFDTLATRYNPRLSDPVKNEYNIYTTKDDLVKYFKVWSKGLIKRPVVYIDATIANTYGYFYPGKTMWYLYYKYNTKLANAGFDYHYNGLSVPRKVLNVYGEYFPHIPIVGLLVNIAFMGWVYFFLFVALIIKKQYKYLPLVFIALSFILTNIAGPANTYFRYAMPYIIPLPLTFALLYLLFHENEKKSSRKKLS